MIDEKPGGARQIHFLPFNKANRDEEFQDTDSGRVDAAFSMTKLPIDNNVKSAFASLKIYMDSYRAKLGKKSEEFKVT